MRLAKSFDLRPYAHRRAEMRLEKLKAETNAIYEAFPELRQGRTTAPKREVAPAALDRGAASADRLSQRKCKIPGECRIRDVEVENAVSRSPLRHSHPAGASNGDST